MNNVGMPEEQESGNVFGFSREIIGEHLRSGEHNRRIVEKGNIAKHLKAHHDLGHLSVDHPRHPRLRRS
eukprot:g61459.t1